MAGMWHSMAQVFEVICQVCDHPWHKCLRLYTRQVTIHGTGLRLCTRWQSIAKVWGYVPGENPWHRFEAMYQVTIHGKGLRLCTRWQSMAQVWGYLPGDNPRQRFEVMYQVTIHGTDLWGYVLGDSSWHRSLRLCTKWQSMAQVWQAICFILPSTKTYLIKWMIQTLSEHITNVRSNCQNICHYCLKYKQIFIL